MKIDFSALEEDVVNILENPEYDNHPAREVLGRLWEMNLNQWNRVERITRLSDSYQDMMMQREKSLSARFDKHLRQLEKITRISDHYQRILKQMNSELEQTALMDPLTELPNRRMMMKRLSHEFEPNSQHKVYCVAMVDVDHFKLINDQHGHQIGDDVLVALGQLMSNIVAEDVHIGRWGGEEFLVLLPGKDQGESQSLMEQMRIAIEQLALNFGDKQLTTSVSIGISQYRQGDTVDSLLTRADDALYVAKSLGRNQISLD
ncbi:diguanylate cyclase domain-containing protein [Marinomonas pollencensis]|uniref:diguanylate cyclase n=1 Tax=Marinomonas pollencensis TaxID=491954 RepID=A0A3E0DLH9_9GAMM|nr:diguanylate cyclase [Marinomonas pollencensis]REG82631.1 diguanylate cyclase (GGDEF)-like protein [Marinomonas pollencensis]